MDEYGFTVDAIEDGDYQADRAQRIALRTLREADRDTDWTDYRQDPFVKPYRRRRRAAR